MYFVRFLAYISACLWTAFATDNGLQTVVTWDQYSLLVNGDRTFILSGEFHYMRLPVPELWLDIFHKFKANGLNTVSIYFFWSYHSASKDNYDFESGGKDIQRLFDYAKEAGIYIIARAGPYNNAEASGGGFALWGGDGSIGGLRTDDETYHQAWLPWITKVAEIIEKNQITKGGTVIINQHENELIEAQHDPNHYLVKYMIQIKAAFLAAGITVPSTHNEKGFRGQSWSTDYLDVGGAVNIYGLDSYPGGLVCTSPDSGFTVVRTYYQWFQNVSFTQPEFSPEFRGGWFSAWGDPSFYDDCKSELDPSFPDVFYKNSIGQRMTMKNIYMMYGGTNWGHIAAPVVYSSYDFSASLRETRQIRDKMSQLKLIGLFTRVSKDLLKTDMIGNGTGYATSSTSVFTWELRNPDTNAGFYITQLGSTSSRASVTFSAKLSTSIGLITVPNVNLKDRQSKILVTDYAFGSHKLIYSTAEILTYGVFGNTDVLVLYAKENQISEFTLTGATAVSKVFGDTPILTTPSTSTTKLNYTQKLGKSVLRTEDGLIVYLLEQKTAWRFWAPATTTNPDIQPSEQIFVFGSYLVRSASIEGNVVKVVGDNDVATTIEVYCGNSEVDTISWNGINLSANTTRTSWGSLQATIPGAEERIISLPVLQDWLSKDSLPEADPHYDDSKWAICNKTKTPNPLKPLTLPVLYASDYGFHPGAKVYRGYFAGNGFSSVNLTCSGGVAFGWTAWLNGDFLGGFTGAPDATVSNAVLQLPTDALNTGQNVITVVTDYHGHDETSTARGLYNPRGILGASLISSSTVPVSGTGFTTWKIQGNAGGEKNIDPTRGPMNEGGLYGERLGWHLPGFQPDSTFSSSSPQIGISKAGIQFYITDFTLDIDTDLDVPIGIEFSAPKTAIARVMFWVNGYQYGKFTPYLGPQTRFPIPPGVLNNKGKNRLVISLWALSDDGAKIDGVRLVSYGAYQSGFEFDADFGYLQPNWDERRLQYA